MMAIKKFCSFPLIIFLTLLSFANFGLANPDNPNPVSALTRLQATRNQHNPIIVPKPPRVNAKAYLLLDVNSGKILAQHDINKRLAPASLTKMMTMYIVSEALKSGQIKLEDKVRISKRAWHTGGSRMFIKAGQRVKLSDLIHGVIVASGNDACVALAEFLAGSEGSFAELMTQRARELGMTESNFIDSTGMPNKKHYSSVRDMAILAQALIKQFPEDYGWYKQKWFKYNGIRQPNRNRLLWRDSTVDGIKTGHTESAGYSLVASAQRNGMRLLSVVMGAPSDQSRAVGSQRLLNYGFRFYETQTLYHQGDQLRQVRVWKGYPKIIGISIPEDLVVTIAQGQYKNLNVELALQKGLMAPINKGQTIGALKVQLHGKTIAEQPIIALATVAKAGLWTRMKDSVSFRMHNWFGNDSTS